MSHDEQLRSWFQTIKIDEACTDADITLDDGSRLLFRHRVGERWVKALGPEGDRDHAKEVLSWIVRFRLNAKHLDIQFSDGSRWELLFE